MDTVCGDVGQTEGRKGEFDDNVETDLRRVKDWFVSKEWIFFTSLIIIS